MEKQKKTDKRFLLIFIAMFVFFFGLAYMLPYTGDDWAWGGQIGIDRLHEHFRNYNGRYLGNLLVIALTRSNLLKSFVMSGTVTGLVFLIHQSVKHKSIATLLLSLTGLFVMPRYIFRQTIAWTSGFTNYVAPTFLVIAYICIIKCIFDGKPKFRKGTFALTLLLGLSSALFMENITLYQIAIDIIIIVGTLVGYKRIFAPVISHFLGSVAGCAIMFTNGAYLNIANSKDDYRTMETTSTGILSRIKENLFDVIRKDLALNNVVLNLFIALVCIALVISFFKKDKDCKLFKKLFIRFNLFIVISYAAYSLCRVIYPNWNIFLNYTKYFESVFVLIFGIALIMLSLLCVDEPGVKLRLSFYIVSIAVLTAPLFVVTPIRSRCFFCGYMFFVLFLCEAFGYVFNEKHSLIKNGNLSRILLAFCICGVIFYTTLYGYIFVAERDRNTYIQEQIAEERSTVELPELPYQGYLWDSTPNIDSMWGDRYKAYKGIDKNSKLEIVRYSDWKESTE